MLGRGSDPAGDKEQGQGRSRKRRGVERDCECVCGRWGRLSTDQDMIISDTTYGR